MSGTFEAWRIFDMSTEELFGALQLPLNPSDKELIQEELDDRGVANQLGDAISSAIQLPVAHSPCRTPSLPPVHGAEPSPRSGSPVLRASGSSCANEWLLRSLSRRFIHTHVTSLTGSLLI